jgi:hypothetical protein
MLILVALGLIVLLGVISGALSRLTKAKRVESQPTPPLQRRLAHESGMKPWERDLVGIDGQVGAGGRRKTDRDNSRKQFSPMGNWD